MKLLLSEYITKTLYSVEENQYSIIYLRIFDWLYKTLPQISNSIVDYCYHHQLEMNIELPNNY